MPRKWLDRWLANGYHSSMIRLFALLLALAFTTPIYAQDGDKPENDESEAEEETGEDSKSEEKDKDDDKKKEPKTIAEVTEDCERIEGLFPFFRHTKNGEVFLELGSEHLGKEFIHFSHVEDGLPRLGLFRGAFGDPSIFKIERHFDRIEFVKQNTAFHVDPDSALSRAANANIAPAIIASEKIEASDDDQNLHLIKADSLFLSELFAQVKPSPPKDDDDKKDDKFSLGDLDDDRTRFTELKNYPENTIFRVAYTYKNLRPREYGEADVTDARFITIQVQHTFIELPENDFVPRFDDPRVGFFSDQITDLTSSDHAPWIDVIHRWHLVKKPDSNEPVEPITWWIENTTPLELRDTIKRAALTWNDAFSDAGFENAVVVKIQPDDAEWDAGDIRYNVLRWTSSPDPPFGGYGPSFANPRTGQILGADIMLEYVFLTNRVKEREMLSGAHPAAERLLSPLGKNSAFCSLGGYMTDQAQFGRTGLALQQAGPLEVDRLLEEALHYLIIHEIGHTLGLNHNFRASQLHSLADIHDREKTDKQGLIGSMMDYPPINFSPDRAKQGSYYSTKPGPYDRWAIQFGYDPELSDAEAMAKHLARSTERALAFANDADDMRSTGRGIDPRAMIGDMTDDPVGYATDRILFVRESLPELTDRISDDGETWQPLRDSFSSLMSNWKYAARTISRQVGGVYVDRSLVGQDPDTAPLTPVPGEQQRRAIEILNDTVFSEAAFEFPPDLLQRLQLQRRGFDHFDLNANEDPKIHDSVASIQRDVLDQILHKNTLQRLIDTELYGNDYSVADLLSDLRGSVMGGDADPSNPNSFRQPLQRDFVQRMITIAGLRNQGNSAAPAIARSEAYGQVLKIQKSLQAHEDSSHVLSLRHIIDRALEGE